jgi:hypothetical protein
MGSERQQEIHPGPVQLVIQSLESQTSLVGAEIGISREWTYQLIDLISYKR